MGMRHRTAHGPEQYEANGSLRAWVNVHEVECLAFTNAEINEVRKLPSHKGFHVIRDPRDVLVSGYFSHKNSHPTEQWPELREHREALRTLSKEEGLLKEIEFSRLFLTAMGDWNYGQDDILELKMEALTQDPNRHFRRILRHLGLYEQQRGTQPEPMQKARQYVNRVVYKLHHELPVSFPRQFTEETVVHPDVLDAIIENHRFEKLTDGRSKGEDDPDSHLRKGEPGDWKNHFTDRVRRAFKDEYGDIVARLGYGEEKTKNASQMDEGRS